jgi:hypothetical protein
VSLGQHKQVAAHHVVVATHVLGEVVAGRGSRHEPDRLGEGGAGLESVPDLPQSEQIRVVVDSIERVTETGKSPPLMRCPKPKPPPKSPKFLGLPPQSGSATAKQGHHRDSLVLDFVVVAHGPE